MEITLNLLIVLILIGGWFWGKVFTRIKLPSVLGMTLWGISLALLMKGNLPPVLGELSPFLKSLALIVILLRAGLGIKKQTLRKVGLPALLLAFIPCLFEGFTLMLLLPLFFGFDFLTAGVCAFILAAVSPAVVVPSMLDLKERGYGAKNDIPTMVLAGASLDDVFAITLFSLFLGMAPKIPYGGAVEAVSNPDISIGQVLLQIPLSIGGGIIGGLIFGFILVYYFKRHHENIRATEKTLLLLSSSILLVQVGDMLHLAALLGVMTMGFLLLERAEEAAGELAGKLNKAWVFAEILLFVLIGMSVDPVVAIDGGLKGLAVISLGLIARSLGVLLALIPAKISGREKLFCVFSYLPKATVQAAMGSVPLALGVAGGETILALAVLAIIFTAPLGLILIRNFGPRLLDIDLPLENEPLEDGGNK